MVTVRRMTEKQVSLGDESTQIRVLSSAMDRIANLFRPQKQEVVPEGPDGDVYPLHLFDDLDTRRIFVTRVLRFNDVLDAGKLQTSLGRLLEIGDWRKLGGQLRRRNDGRLEVHVPKQFTASQPAFTFSHNQQFVNMSIHDHPEASRLHIATAGPSTLAVPPYTSMFATPPDFPTTVDDMIKRGLPQLLLHITSFSDATLVSLVWPHTLSDASGVLSLLQNWSHVLSGREEQVSPLLGAWKDVLLEAENVEAESDREPWKIEPMCLEGLSMLAWGLRYLWYWIRSPALEPRTIFLPRETGAKIKAQIQKDIASMPEDTAQQNFASEGDIFSAWVTHIFAASEATKRPMTIAAFYNLRRPISSAMNTSGLYVQNMLMLTYAFISPQLLDGPVGPVAVAHRRQLEQQTTVPQALACSRRHRLDLETTGRQRDLFGEANSQVILFNNLLKAGYLTDVDFSAAVVSSGETAERRNNPPGTPIVYSYRVESALLDKVTSFYMLGKDHGGNYWFQGNLRPAAWAEMEARLRRLDVADAPKLRILEPM